LQRPAGPARRRRRAADRHERRLGLAVDHRLDRRRRTRLAFDRDGDAAAQERDADAPDRLGGDAQRVADLLVGVATLGVRLVGHQ